MDSETTYECPECGAVVLERDGDASLVCGGCGSDVWICEFCDNEQTGEHYSAADCNETGEGVRLCEPCAQHADATAGQREREREQDRIDYLYEEHMDRKYRERRGG